jgi:hypothetical protein
MVWLVGNIQNDLEMEARIWGGKGTNEEFDVSDFEGLEKVGAMLDGLAKRTTEERAQQEG